MFKNLSIGTAGLKKNLRDGKAFKSFQEQLHKREQSERSKF